MATVTITRHTHRYRRSANGAWLGAGSEKETLVRGEEVLRSGFSIGDGIEVEWPDGVKESCWSRGTSHSGKPYLTIIPAGGRLAALLHAD